MYPGFEIHFEMTMRSILGDEADHIASQARDKTFRKKWYEKALKRLLVQVAQIDTTTKHKESLTTWSECALKAATECDEQKLLMYVLRLSAVLLGFAGVRGSVLYIPIYSQNNDQYYTEVIMQGGDPMQDYYDKKNNVALRRGLVLQLKEQGFTDFKISQVLNITEYQVKKLRKEL
ncbi:MAG TPA: hypothetical protein PL131_04710 [Methylotenera sp.]|nr:hypothetical protein [Methylotenera sp.]HPH05156.1 hypothetical protein [Methylotenera sp.]HPN00520.1 hypothetical protein [Methylotenera sp.]